jgi:hypothetical protein
MENISEKLCQAERSFQKSNMNKFLLFNMHQPMLIIKLSLMVFPLPQNRDQKLPNDKMPGFKHCLSYLYQPQSFFSLASLFSPCN